MNTSTSPLNWLQPALCPLPSSFTGLWWGGHDIRSTKHRGVTTKQCNNAHCGAAPLSGWTIPNDQSLGRNNTGAGNRYRPTSCPEFKFRICSKHFAVVLSSSTNGQIKEWVLGRDIVMDTEGVVCRRCADISQVKQWEYVHGTHTTA